MVSKKESKVMKVTDLNVENFCNIVERISTPEIDLKDESLSKIADAVCKFASVEMKPLGKK